MRQAEVSDALRAELETKAGDYNFALEKKYAYPSAFRVVDEVSRVLPDDTWLTQMEMKTIAKGKETQREILVRGETANAGRLVQLVEESTLFAQTAPRSPTTKIQPGPGEIFDLGAQVKPLAAPAQVALLGADKSATRWAMSRSPPPRPADRAGRPCGDRRPPPRTETGHAPSAEMGPEAPRQRRRARRRQRRPETSASTATAPAAPSPRPRLPPSLPATVPLAVAPATTAAPRSSAPPAGRRSGSVALPAPKPGAVPPAAARHRRPLRPRRRKRRSRPRATGAKP